MTTASTARLASLTTIALLLACTTDSDQRVIGIQAMSFANSEWSEPVNLGAPINSSANEMNPALSPDELSLYFVSTRAGGLGGGDIWVSRRASLESPWGEPVNLGPNVNGPGIDGSPVVSLDGHLLFFTSDRAGGQGSNDIYVASIKTDGETQGPAVPVAELNDPDPAITDAHPSLRVDGREVYFYSNRPGSLGASDIWRSTRRSVHEPWSTPENVGAPLSTAANEIQPTLSYSGRTLVFASTRGGGLGSSDIWMSTRTPSGKETP